jgi:anaerobic selenocysteine-containing dehydrogenase
MPDMNRRTFLRIGAFSAGAVASAYALGNYIPLLNEQNEPIVDPEPPPLLAGEDYFPTACWVGKGNCGISARRYNGRILKLEGHIMHPRNSGKLCPKGQAQLLSVYDPFRIKAPLIRVNEKGVPGKFTEGTWPEALALVGDKIKAAVAKDPKLVVWQKGREEDQQTFDEAFAFASGATLLAMDGLMDGAGVRATDYTLGYRSVLSPDLRNCNYLISWGWNLIGSGGNQHCWLTHQQEFMGARERGMKVVTLDPRLGGMGPHTDTWLPIKPGTDLAFFLAMANVLVDKSYLDEDYLVNNTNSPYLVGPDGEFLVIGRKEQVLDQLGEVVPYDTADVLPLLLGEATVDGTEYRTAFSIYKDHIGQYTPAWAAEITGLREVDIQAISEELGHQALLGSKLTIDPSKAKPCYAACHGDPFEGAGGGAEGEAKDYVYRPVGIMADHVTQQEMGFQAVRAAEQVFMLLGAINAVGGVHPDFSMGVTEDFAGYDDIKVRSPPYDITLEKSKYFPLNSVNPSMVSQVINTPGKFDVDPSSVPEVLVVRGANNIIDAASQQDMMDAYAKYDFVAVIDPWLNETADYYADVVLPSATMEQYDGPLNVSTMYTEAFTLRLPPISPLFSSRGYIDIIIDLAEEAGVLYGPGGMNDILNQMLKFQSAFRLDLDTKTHTRSILSRWAKSNGIEQGVRFFEEAAVTAQNRTPEAIYTLPDHRSYNGVRHRFYGASLKEAQTRMIDAGADTAYTQDYTALPTWRTPTFEGSDEKYDLTLITYKKVQYIQSRATHFVHMNELEPDNRLLMNLHTAEERGIHEDDEAWIESHNAVTGDTRKVKAKVQLIEGIRPDTVALSNHYGGWVHPWVKDGGPTPNTLFYTGKGYVTNTMDQSFHVKVKVKRAG